MKKLLLASAIAFSAVSCTTQSAGKTSFINKKPDEINTTPALRAFLARNKNPKIVLRVSNVAGKLSTDNNTELVYNTIEKVFIANGFQVRDRMLFNQIIDNKDNSTNYENLYKKSDTDLIIELMDTNPLVRYTTNRFIDNNTKEEKTGPFTLEQYGSNIEFKVIIIKSNEFAGAYKFNQTPCTDGCIYEMPSINVKDLKAKFKKDKNLVYADNTVSYDKQKYEDFIKTSTQALIDAMRSSK